MRIAVCSTYPPRECGLATFAADLVSALAPLAGVADVRIIAVRRAGECEPERLRGEGSAGTFQGARVVAEIEDAQSLRRLEMVRRVVQCARQFV